MNSPVRQLIRKIPFSRSLLLYAKRWRYTPSVIKRRLQLRFEHPTKIELQIEGSRPKPLYVYLSDLKGRAYAESKTAANVELATFKSFAPNADLIFDVGCNYGEFTLSLDYPSLKQDVFIAAFEPNPHVFSALRSSIEANGLSASVRLENRGCGAENGSFRFFHNLFSSGNSSLIHQNDTVPFGIKTETVPVVTIDSFVSDAELTAESKVVLLKTDTEENDFNVLEGARRTLEAAQRFLIVAETSIESLREEEQKNRGLLEYLFQPKHQVTALFSNTPHACESIAHLHELFDGAAGHIDLLIHSE